MNIDSERLLRDLNAQQRKAVLIHDRPVLVVAGPGTGKTKTLTIRLAYLLSQCHVAPQALLAVTFTTRAAKEMQERLERLVGGIARQIFLGTFHSWCAQLLRMEGKRLDLPPDFGIADRGDQTAIMQKVLRETGYPDHRSVAQRTLHDLSAMRNHVANFNPQLEEKALRDIHDAYRQRLRKHGLLDFDDLLRSGVQLLEEWPGVRQNIQRQYAHVAVDEYQDVSPVQCRLLQLLVGERGNLWAVGDADQAIYAFRGAESAQFLQFEKGHPSGRVVRLEQSYRFTPQIAATASQIIAKNVARYVFTLKTDNRSGLPIHIVSCPDEHAEAAWIVKQLEESVGGTSHFQQHTGSVRDTVSQRARSFRDFAVLYRLHALSQPLQEALTKSGMPFRVIGETRFFDKTVVKDVLAYLRVIQNPHDDASLGRIMNRPPRGIGTQTQTALESQADRLGVSLYHALEEPSIRPPSQSRSIEAFVMLVKQLQGSVEEKPLSQFLAHMAEVTGLRQWRVEQHPHHDNDVLLLRSMAAKYDELATPVALKAFLEEATLAVEADEYDASADAVSLMTIHAAKGLEFAEVMLCGVEEGSLPYENGDLEEERRLLYVGLTRAKERVHALHCRSRFLFGERRDRAPSRFLSEFDESLRETTVIPDCTRRSKKPEEPQQLSLL